MLLEELRANPDDDALRLVYADQLASTDPRHAELIALQCARDLPRDRSLAARRRVAELLASNGARWSKLAGLATRWSFARGFVDRVTIDAATFVERGDELLAIAPLVRWLEVTNVSGAIGRPGGGGGGVTAWLDRVFEAVRRHRIAMLDLGDVWVAGAPTWQGWLTNFVEPVIERLIATRTLRALRGLALRDVTGSALRALAESEEAAGLDELDIAMETGHRHGLALPDGVLRPRRLHVRMPSMHRQWVDERDTWLERVSDLGYVYSAQLPAAVRPRLRRLELRTDLAADPLRAIAEDPAYRGVQELAVEGPGTDALAAFTPLLRTGDLGLRVLRLAFPVDRRLVTAVLDSPLARTLEVLDLRDARNAPELQLPRTDVIVLRPGPSRD